MYGSVKCVNKQGFIRPVYSHFKTRTQGSPTDISTSGFSPSDISLTDSSLKDSSPNRQFPERILPG